MQTTRSVGGSEKVLSFLVPPSESRASVTVLKLFLVLPTSMRLRAVLDTAGLLACYP